MTERGRKKIAWARNYELRCQQNDCNLRRFVCTSTTKMVKWWVKRCECFLLVCAWEREAWKPKWIENDRELKFSDSIEKNHEMSSDICVCVCWCCLVVVVKNAWNIKWLDCMTYSIHWCCLSSHTVCIINWTKLLRTLLHSFRLFNWIKENIRIQNDKSTKNELTFCSHRPHKTSCWLWPGFVGLSWI